MTWLPRRLLLALTGTTALSGCGRASTTSSPDSESPSATTSSKGEGPSRIWIRPDDYHVPYAGTAGDGRRFFVSEELFAWTGSNRTTTSSLPKPDGFTATFWWKADGSFDEVTVDEVARDANLPPGQAGPPDDGAAVLRRHLAALGRYTLEPIHVEPFLTQVDGVDFGWRYSVFEGRAAINIEPGDFICYYEPWDGEGYDT